MFFSFDLIQDHRSQTQHREKRRRRQDGGGEHGRMPRQIPTPGYRKADARQYADKRKWRNGSLTRGSKEPKNIHAIIDERREAERGRRDLCDPTEQAKGRRVFPREIRIHRLREKRKNSVTSLTMKSLY